MNFKYVIFFCLFGFLNLNAQSIVKSPDGKLKVSVSISNEMPLYSITYDDKIFLENSPLGLKTNVGDFSTGLSLKSEPHQNKIDQKHINCVISSKVRYIMKLTKPYFLSLKKANLRLM